MKQRTIRTIPILLILTLIIATFPPVAKGVSVSARSAILMEQESGRVLFEKDAQKVRRIASITKIMTAILAIESGKLQKNVTVTKNAEGTEGSSIYLQAGEKIKLEDLVYGLMLRSGNDSAVAIAEYVGGSLEGFVYLMNKKAEMIGMTNTVFANPHGLDDHENHYSTAYDMALLTRYAMKDKTYREIVSTEFHRAPNPHESWDRTWKNKNKLLTGLYSYSTGGKTGYTERANRTLVSTATKNGVDLIAVTLNGPDDWNDHINMFNWGFESFKLYKLVEKSSTLNDIEDEFYKKHIYLKRNFMYPLLENEKSKITVEIKLLKPKDGWENSRVPDQVGTVVVKNGHETIAKIPVFYKRSDNEEKSGWIEWFKDLFLSIMGVQAYD